MKITVIDYGLSNLLSVRRAIEHLGFEAELSGDADVVRKATALILPGVGAFRDGMAGLEKLGLTQVIRQCAAQGTPLLGICLGMQMLFEESEEFGLHKGLGLIPGRVVRLPAADIAGARQNVPQVGWNGLLPPNGKGQFSSALFSGSRAGDEVYFVHSYEAKPRETADCLAVTLYGGRPVCAAAGRRNTFGTQFHPEKSGEAGLRILRQYLAIAAGCNLTQKRV